VKRRRDYEQEIEAARCMVLVAAILGVIAAATYAYIVTRVY
jgi:hypothetical protein